MYHSLRLCVFHKVCIRVQDTLEKKKEKRIRFLDWSVNVEAGKQLSNDDRLLVDKWLIVLQNSHSSLSYYNQGFDSVCIFRVHVVSYHRQAQVKLTIDVVTQLKIMLHKECSNERQYYCLIWSLWPNYILNIRIFEKVEHYMYKLSYHIS